MVAGRDYGTGTVQRNRSQAERVGIDIETTGLDPRKDHIVGIGVVYDEEAEFVDLRGAEEWKPVPRWANGYLDSVEVVGHNLGFDLSFLRQKYGVPYPTKIWDTMVVEQALTAGYDWMESNLNDVSLRYLGQAVDKTLQTTFTLESEPTEEQIQYALNDVRASLRIAEMQRKKIKEHGMERLVELEMAVLPIFAEMVRVGVRIDLDVMLPLLEETRKRHKTLSKALQEVLTPHVEWHRIRKRDQMQDKLDEWQARYDAEKEKAEDHWIEIVGLGDDGWNKKLYFAFKDKKWLDLTRNQKDGFPEGCRRYVKAHMKDWRAEVNKEGKKINERPLAPKLDTSLINLNSPDQMKAAFNHLGIELPNMKKESIGRILLESSPEQKHILQMTMEYKKAEKLLSSFGEALLSRLDDNNCLHGNFKQYGTATGRPSCSQPNMLQIPSKKNNSTFRKAFVPREGNLFIVADYSQIELRIMAELSGDKAMMKAFEDGLDLHTYTASLMFNVPLEEVTDRQRSTAKTINFGILYGMGPKKLRETLIVDGIEMTMQEAVAAVEQWKKSYAHAAAKIQEWQESVLQLGYTVTPLGRKRFFDINTEDKYERFGIQRAGANHVIQGTSADITKLAMACIQFNLGGLPGVIVLQIYDEIVLEVPEDLAHWAKDMVQSSMEVAAEEVLRSVPVKVDAVISTSWSEEDAIS